MPRGVYQHKPLTEEHKQKLRAINIRLGLRPPSNKGKPHSIKTKIKMREAQLGRKNHQWKDGLGNFPGRKIKQEEIAGRKRPDQCELCGTIGIICFDHDHLTGEFRGWICRRCNLAFGLVKDNSELLLAMVGYLKKSRTP